MTKPFEYFQRQLFHLFMVLLLISLPGPLTLIVEAADRPPNVIIMMPDQMRGQAMSVAGNKQVHTPRLERLAEGGLYLPNTIANCPVCCPARATILTGMYPHRNGMMINDLRLREDHVSLAELLAEAGYTTAFVGKWHLDGGPREPGFVPPGQRRQGFQYWAANVCDHRHFDWHYFRGDSDQPIVEKRFEPIALTDEAISFIREHREKPFFLWWACSPPHDPYGAPPEYERMYDPAKLELRPNYQPRTEWGSRGDIASYYAAITAIDEQVGRVLDELHRLKLADDTLFIFISDHGDMLGSQGLRLKCKPYEESICVPGIVRYPRRIKAGGRMDLLFTHVDIAPTILGFCGRPVPASMQGRDLSGLLSGQPGEAPQAALLQIFEPRPQTDVPAPWRGVRTIRYTYARFKDKPWCLYDNLKDPYQMDNLVGRPETADLEKKMEILLQREMAGAGDSWTFNFDIYHLMYKQPPVYHPDELKGLKP